VIPTNLFDQINSLMFIKDSKRVISMKGRLHEAQKEKEEKFQGFSKTFLLRGIVHQNLGNWMRFM
jgi:hypothetical protein